MVQIFRSSAYWGHRTYLEFDPSIHLLRDHVFNPDPARGAPGLYDFGQKLVHQSVYSRGPDPAALIPPVQPNFRYEDVVDQAPEDAYIYLGLFHAHYGHFLLSTLSRLWTIRDLPNHPIVCFPPVQACGLLRPYVLDILRALDIDPARLVSFGAPVKMREIILPCASFEEQNFAHRAFARLSNAIGERVAVGATPSTISTRPLYLSKQRISSGVRKIVNEDAICDHLAKRGVDIVWPEELSFPEQVALWRAERPIVAFSGSGLHTSVFSPGSKLICLNYTPYINSSFALCDWANETRAAYFHFDETIFDDLGQLGEMADGTGVTSALRAREPEAVAEAILRIIDAAAMTDAPSLSRLGSSQNLSRGRPTTQSSVVHEDETIGRTATSGFLTGTFQFHTACEQDPWWQVDLGAGNMIVRVVIYNRTDHVAERTRHLVMSVSDDGDGFRQVYARTDDDAFGGLNGDPLVVTFSPALEARWLRLSLVGTEFLHLDQVEVFGTASAPAS